MKPPKNEVGPNKIRIVCIADSHSLQNSARFPEIPEGDILIHAGDFTRCGGRDEVEDFNNYLGTLPHQHKLVIAGNHELSFDPTFTNPYQSSSSSQQTKHSATAIIDEIPTLGNTKESLREAVQTKNIRELLTNCTYLEDQAIELYGIKFYGTPWQPEFCRWAFNLPRGQACLEKWNQIPDDTDVLITHTPPLGYGDLVASGVRAGCVELLSTVQKRVKPKYHIFGHVHEARGKSMKPQDSLAVEYLKTNLNYRSFRIF